jgi:hypothetical protein
MKRIIVLLLAIIFTSAAYSQHLSLNAYGGYSLQDKVSFSNGYGYINASGHWGASIEGVSQRGAAIELMYQRQDTKFPFYPYGSNVGKQEYSGSIDWILLNFENYFTLSSPVVHPYAGLGLGVAILSGANSQTKFAWDLKGGVKIKASKAVGVKLQAQLMSMSQASSAGFYVGGGGGGTYVSTYSSVFQLGFTGGLCFDFGGKH